MKQVQIGSYVMKEDVIALGADNWSKFRDWLKENTKLRVNNGLGNYSGGVMYESNHAVHLDYSGLLQWCGEEDMEECRHQLTAQDILEIINPKEEIKMKKDWSIKVNSKEQGEMYKKVLMALGYTFVGIENPTEVFMIRHGSGQVGIFNTNFMWFSKLEESSSNHFSSLEDFLMWHFQPELTEQQKKIKDLEETINKAQKQIEQLNKQAILLEKVIKNA